MNRIILFLLLVLPTFLHAQVSDSTRSKGASEIQNSSENRIGQTRAVIVGISDYQNPKIPDLNYGHRDAIAFSNYLLSPAGGSLSPDHIKLITNDSATAGNFTNALFGLIDSSKQGDRAIIYFSGHGDVNTKLSSKPGFLLCWDSPSELYTSGGVVELGMFQEIISTLSGNKVEVLVITDACHSGRLSGSSMSGPNKVTGVLAAQFTNEAKILSCREDEISLEGPQWGDGRGVFSYYLLKGLFGQADRDKDDVISMKEIDRFLEDNVSTQVEQNPFTVGDPKKILFAVDPFMLSWIDTGDIIDLGPQMAVLGKKGVGDRILESEGPEVQQQYTRFYYCLENRKFFQSSTDTVVGDFAQAYYNQLLQIPALAPLYGSMRYDFAAALQDEAQQVINKILEMDLSELILSPKTKYEKYKDYPNYLTVAAELLGPQNAMYPVLKSRAYFFKGYLLSLQETNPNTELGEKILGYYNKSLQLQPNLPHVFDAMVPVYGYLLLKPDSMEHFANLASEIMPTWSQPLSRVAFIYATRYKNFDKAKFYLKKADKVDPNAMTTLNAWGVYYKNNKQYPEAERIYKRIIATDPGAPSIFAHINLGVLYRELRSYSEAEFQLGTAITLDSTFAAAYYNLGNVYKEAGLIDDAVDQYEQSLLLDSTNVLARVGMSEIFLEDNCQEEAAYQLTQAVQANPTLFNAHRLLGELFLKKENYGAASSHLLRAIEIDSSQATIWNSLGILYRKTKQPEKSEQLLKKAIRLYPFNSQPYDDLGVLYVQMNRLAEAKEQFEKAMQIDRKEPLHPLHLAGLDAMQNKKNEAFQYLDRALENGFDDKDALLKYEELQLLRMDEEKWKKLLKKYFPDKN